MVMFTFWPCRLSLPNGLQNCCCSHCKLSISSSMPQGINDDNYGDQQIIGRQQMMGRQCQQQRVPMPMLAMTGGGTENAINNKTNNSRRQRRHSHNHHQIRRQMPIHLIPLKCSIGTQTDQKHGNAQEDVEMIELCTELAIRLQNIADGWKAKLETHQKHQQRTKMTSYFLKWILWRK